ncbi:hypothetical protein AURANDRAFT_33120, partial [Aureococcus anophagefferens]
ISYHLGLTGPCVTLDTACSSSLVTLHLGAVTLEINECTCACSTSVGILTQDSSLSFAGGGMLSNLGRCHTFDGRADGYCRGEGCGAFLLVMDSEIGAARLGSAVQ